MLSLGLKSISVLALELLFNVPADIPQCGLSALIFPRFTQLLYVKVFRLLADAGVLLKYDPSSSLNLRLCPVSKGTASYNQWLEPYAPDIIYHPKANNGVPNKMLPVALIAYGTKSLALAAVERVMPADAGVS